LAVSYSTWAIEMVMPRCFSSGALSIWSNGVNEVLGLFSDKTFVMAAVSVVLPWSMCPIVPTFKWGFDRSNFCLAICRTTPDLGRRPLGPARRLPALLL
jgi:hypothetical protein